MEDPKQNLIQKLRDAGNVLVTVSNNPSVDQLAGAIGLTLLLNKLGKHATAVFSGKVPDVLEFLKPEATIEKTTDSLRDFIIALDKGKADKLRYKVEDTMVKIFITPYHTALSDKDLEFSQGDFNVDLVVAIGAHEQADLDQAITSHGRILHDATVSSINTLAAGNIGTINWVDPAASSLCEMLFDLCKELQPEGVDASMATALLTGIVSETRRFGNEKTTAKSLEASSQLVSAGANQQLVAAKLEEKAAPIPEKQDAKPIATQSTASTGTGDTNQEPEAVPQSDGTVNISHDDEEKPAEASAEAEEIHIDEEGMLKPVTEDAPAAVLPAPTPPAPTGSALENAGPKFMVDPPTLGGQLTANTQTESQNGYVDPLSNPSYSSAMPLLSHDSGPAAPPASALFESPQPSTAPNRTLTEIEQSVSSPHAAVEVDAAREAVENASNASPDFRPTPIQALNAQHIDLGKDTALEPPVSGMPGMTFTSPVPSVSTLPDPALPPSLNPLDPGEPSNYPNSTLSDQSPPPVPPPMMPPSFATAPPSDSSNQDTQTPPSTV